ncbi:MAG: sigma-70 family RNA polymerase sigma factor, partial [Chitinophagaceae bacterium]|nr:sigma-70 family RNA polymerase sigma factor [Chitinophagaceae bacterium]
GFRYVKDNFAVEELASDILFNLWIRRHELVIETSLSAYLFQAMHFKAISHLRKKSTANLDIESLPEDSLVADNTADQQVVLKDMQGIYGEKLEQLSAQRQKVFRLSREQQLSYNDIAQEMKLSANTVRNHMNAALEYLRRHLPNSLMLDLLLLFPFFS